MWGTGTAHRFSQLIRYISCAFKMYFYFSWEWCFIHNGWPAGSAKELPELTSCDQSNAFPEGTWKPLVAQEGGADEQI